MPFLIRILAGLILRRALARAAAGAGAARTGRTSASGAHDLTRLRARAVELGALGAHIVALVVFLMATLVLLTAGGTLASLGPRWLGITFLLVAAATALLAGRELRGAWRIRLRMVRRRHDGELRHRLDA